MENIGQEPSINTAAMVRLAGGNAVTGLCSLPARRNSLTTFTCSRSVGAANDLVLGGWRVVRPSPPLFRGRRLGLRQPVFLILARERLAVGGNFPQLRRTQHTVSPGDDRGLRARVGDVKHEPLKTTRREHGPHQAADKHGTTHGSTKPYADKPDEHRSNQAPDGP